MISHLLYCLETFSANVTEERSGLPVYSSVDVGQSAVARSLIRALIAFVQLHIDFVCLPQVTAE